MKRWYMRGAVMAVTAVAGWASLQAATDGAPPPSLPVATPAEAGPVPATGPTALYEAKCGVCHTGAGNPGYIALQHAGRPEPDLSKRTTLAPAYVRMVVRQGLGRMPPMTPTYVSDQELELIVSYLDSRE